MTPTPRPGDPDAAWLEALAGRPAAGLDEPSRQEAERLRRAIAQRKAELESVVPDASEAEFERLRERLMIEQPKPAQSLGTVVQDGYRKSGDDTASYRGSANSPKFLWVVAASFLLAVTVIAVHQSDDSESSTQYRALNSTAETVKYVEDVEFFIRALKDDLGSRNIPFREQQLSDGDVRFIFPQSLAAGELLDQLDIQKPVTSGEITLRIAKRKGGDP